MVIKNCIAINDLDPNNIKIYNLETDQLLNLNEEASIIFLNIEKSDAEIKKIFMDTYNIQDVEILSEDIKKIKKFLKDNIYE